MKKKITHIIGVDEAGRGPLAGPVAVGVAQVPVTFNWTLLPKVADSKQLSEEVREEIFTEAHNLQKKGLLTFRVAMVSASVIDTIGITRAVTLGIERALLGINPNPKTTDVRLDGLLKAPEEFLVQRTIIKGDQKERSIGLASILAKVTRDRYMKRKAREFSVYGFEKHKGYGTKQHQEMLRIHGPSKLHRSTYISKFIT